MDVDISFLFRTFIRLYLYYNRFYEIASRYKSKIQLLNNSRYRKYQILRDLISPDQHNLLAFIRLGLF